METIRGKKSSHEGSSVKLSSVFWEGHLESVFDTLCDSPWEPERDDLTSMSLGDKIALPFIEGRVRRLEKVRRVNGFIMQCRDTHSTSPCSLRGQEKNTFISGHKEDPVEGCACLFRGSCPLGTLFDNTACHWNRASQQQQELQNGRGIGSTLLLKTS